MIKRIIHEVKNHWPLTLFLFFYFFLISYKVIRYVTPFYDWDESIYAQVGHEMVQNLSLVPLWQGQHWLDKPPLVPLFYGIIELIPAPPEISTRIFTLLTAIVVLILFYTIYNRVTKNKLIALLTVIITAFTPIFLQRAQVLNVDIFLLLGWAGYVVFFPKFYLSLLFLAIGVLSKSLLGFYPPLIFAGYFTMRLFLKQISFKIYKKQVGAIITQIGILLIWYIAMIAVFRQEFISDHFLDSHLKRVTASIESHFGKRTFYIDLLYSQMSNFALPAIAGSILLFIRFLKRRSLKELLYSLFFIPWFIFLNLTKTKIEWYLYPILAQFAFLSMYPLDLLKSRKYIMYIVGGLIIIFILYQNLVKDPIVMKQYSSYDSYFTASQEVQKKCSGLTVIVDPITRSTYNTLQKMDLVIKTTTWWGNHPSMVYYSGKKIDFIYDVTQAKQKAKTIKKGECILIERADDNLVQGLRLKEIHQSASMRIFTK